jgi:hypothetical protein
MLCYCRGDIDDCQMDGTEAELIGRGETIAYDSKAFDALIEEWGIHHNAVIERFQT